VQKFLSDLPAAEADKVLAGSNPHETVNKLTDSAATGPAERGDVVRLLEAAAGLH
jgi:hypothetical protein